MEEIQAATVVGMGALGLLFAGQIAEKLGPEAVCFVADAQRLAAYESRQFTINGRPRTFSLRESQAAGPAQLLLVAVKFGALEAAMETMAPCVGEQTVILSVLNGISSEAMLARRFPEVCILNTVAQGMDAMKFGPALQYTQPGQLLLGMRKPGQEAQLAAVTRFLSRAGVPHQMPTDIQRAMWGKFMLNVGVNQTCMAFETNYGGVLRPGEARDVMLAAMHEVRVLANAVGVALTPADVDVYDQMLATLSPEGVPSMRQDALARRPSEVEMFAGTVRTLCRQQGCDCPTNDFLYRRIREMEAAYQSGAAASIPPPLKR